MVRFSGRMVGLIVLVGLALLVGSSSVTVAQDKGNKEITVAPQVLLQYAGVYELAPNFKMMITVEGTQLMAQASGQPKLAAYARSETRFFFKEIDAEIEFFKDDKGVVSRLVLRQNNQEMTAPRVAARPEVAVSPAILAQYVGTYELQPKFNMMITVEGGQLMTQASGQVKTPVSASSETKFFSKFVDAEIEFIKDDKGVVSHLVLRQNNQVVKAPRISDKVAERKEITLSPKILERYVGTYELQPGLEMAVTLDGDKLMAAANQGGETQLFAESETKFFLKVVDADLEFVRDDKGVVTHLIMHQGPTEIKAPKK
jgi:hypothetical protein